MNKHSRVEFKDADKWLADRLQRGQSEMFFEVATLTPHLAELLLARNNSNRALSEKIVMSYAMDIEENRWQMNGESIKISKSGWLNDGQHRCKAVSLSGRSIVTAFAFGLDRYTRLTLDQGKQRSPGDYLGMQGITNANHVAAVAALISMYTKHGIISRSGNYKSTKQQILAIVDDHPRIADSLDFVRRSGSAVLGSRAMLAFCHYTFAQVDRAMADEFFDAVLGGAGLAETDVRLLVRNRLINSKGLHVGHRVELLFRAWGHFRRRSPVTKLQLTGGPLPAIA